jgi:hypothetical protein
MPENKAPNTPVSELEKLRSDNEALRKAESQRNERESRIRARMSAGISREQAEAAEKHQDDYNAAKAKVRK